MAPGNRNTVLVEARREAVVIVGPVDIVLNVFFAGPHHFHRTVDLPSDPHGQGDAIDVQPATEAAAEQLIVDLDLLERQAGDLRGRGLRAAQHLRSHPDVTAVLAHMNGAVHRLHGGVRQKRHLVDRLDPVGGVGHGLGDIALLDADHTRPSARRFELPHEIGGGEMSRSPRRPT